MNIFSRKPKRPNVNPGDTITFKFEGEDFIRTGEVEYIAVYGAVTKAARDEKSWTWVHRPMWEDILTVNGKKFKYDNPRKNRDAGADGPGAGTE